MWVTAVGVGAFMVSIGLAVWVHRVLEYVAKVNSSTYHPHRSGVPAPVVLGELEAERAAERVSIRRRRAARMAANASTEQLVAVR